MLYYQGLQQADEAAPVQCRPQFVHSVPACLDQYVGQTCLVLDDHARPIDKPNDIAKKSIPLGSAAQGGGYP